MKSNIILIETLVNSNLERHYAVWLRLKHLHINSKIYNFSENKIAKQSGLSRTAIKKYINFFIENKWCKIVGNDIVFISHNKLKYLYGIKEFGNITIAFKTQIKELISIIRYELFKDKQRKFIYIRNLRNDLNNPKTLISYKRAKAKLKNSTKGEVSENIKISTNKLGIIINKSASTASRLVKQMGATVISGRKTLCKFSKKVELPTNCFQYKGLIIKSEANQYIF
jgi:hypothetical protein